MVGADADTIAAPSLEQQNDTAKAAAISSALDFYAYVWNQLAPLNEYGVVPGGLEPNDSDMPPEMYRSDWYGWKTWASTIRSGFTVAPDLCEALVHEEASYGSEFVDAVEAATDGCAATAE